MAEYIDKDRAYQTLADEPFFFYFDRDEIVFPVLAAMPAADVAPVVHGRWDHIWIVKKIGPIYPHCSACGIVSAAYRSQWEGLQGPWKYCPNCGAIMDGGDSDAKSV